MRSRFSEPASVVTKSFLKINFNIFTTGRDFKDSALEWLKMWLESSVGEIVYYLFPSICGGVTFALGNLLPTHHVTPINKIQC